MKKIIITITLILLTTCSVAAEDYKYCEITGLALGAGKEFVGAVSYRIMQRQNLVGNSACHAVWSDAYKIGQKFASGDMKTQQDFAALKKLQDFEVKVIDSIIENMQIEDIHNKSIERG